MRNAAYGFLTLIMAIAGLSSTTAGVHPTSGPFQAAAVQGPGIGPHRWV